MWFISWTWNNNCCVETGLLCVPPLSPLPLNHTSHHVKQIIHKQSWCQWTWLSFLYIRLLTGLSRIWSNVPWRVSDDRRFSCARGLRDWGRFYLQFLTPILRRLSLIIQSSFGLIQSNNVPVIREVQLIFINTKRPFVLTLYRQCNDTLFLAFVFKIMFFV